MAREAALRGLSELLRSGPTAFVGLGNRDRGDDAIGLRFIDDLRPLNPNLFFSEEDGLESVILRLMEADEVENVVFIDAADMSLPPGDYDLVGGREIESTELTTHKAPIALMIALLGREGKSARLLGIQPESIEFRAPVSERALTALREVEALVRRELG